MNDIFLYLLKVTASTAVFYFIYYAFLKNETYFKLNRFYLLLSVLLSFILPFLHFSSQGIQLPLTFSETLNTVSIYSNRPVISESYINVTTILLLVYVGIAAFFVFRYMFKIIFLISIFLNKPFSFQNKKYKLIKTNKDIPPCSFFNYIIIPDRLDESNDLSKILIHEKVHVKQMHSIDTLILEFISAILWFNPFVWKIKSAIKNTHEYLADEGVVEQGFDTTGYRLLLLEHAVGFKLGLANNFNQSITLKRILMLNKSKSSWMAKLKVLSAIPVLFFLIGIFSCDPQAKEPKNILKSSNDEVLLGNDKKNTTDSTYISVDEMPVFPGGNDELISYLSSNIKYPQEAKEKGIQGKVYVGFIVKKDGSIANVSITKLVNPFLDKEAMRVISSMPKWAPGKNEGKFVDVQFTIPINFQLQ